MLSSYNLERQPVGAHVVKMTNESIRTWLPLWAALGMLESTTESRLTAAAELDAPSLAGVARRARLAESMAACVIECTVIRKRGFNG